MIYKSLIIFNLCAITYQSYAQNVTDINFMGLLEKGVMVQHDFKGQPDEYGVFQYSKCIFPKFEKGVYYSCYWWPTGANRVYGNVFNSEEYADLQGGGMFLLLKLNDNRFLSVLPLASSAGYSWFDADSSSIILQTGHHGKSAVIDDIPLFAWAFGENPYEACNTVWKTALRSEYLEGITSMREQKKYPEVFGYLGWCSWEQYRLNITQENMIDAIHKIEDSDVPIRYFLLDDGYFDGQSLKPNENFPDGLSVLTELKKEDKIKWMGLWNAFLGDDHGIKTPGNIGSIKENVIEAAAGILMPEPEDKIAADRFYDFILSNAKKNDFDFVKIDFMCDALTFYSGATHKAATGGLPDDNSQAVGNPVNAAIQLSRSLQKKVTQSGLSILNCNWHQTIPLLYSGESATGRCSEDYKLGNLQRAKNHLYHSFAATPWIGQIVWGDHDMFHSNDTTAGRMMALSKAISGGPVYLSDDPSNFMTDNIRPLCYKDGKLIRPIAPAAPFPSDIFKEVDDSSLYHVIAPLPNRSAAIVLYNYHENQIYQSVIKQEDYCEASGMIQPYVGKWEIPQEGIYLYDWYLGEGEILEKEYKVEIGGVNDRLLLLVPVQFSWAIIGRADKFLSPATYQINSISSTAVHVKMDESGPFLFWCKDKNPRIEGVNLLEKGNGLWLADFPDSNTSVEFSIKVIGQNYGPNY